MILGAATPVADFVSQLTHPGALGPPENVWLCALGLAVLGPALATVAPRLMRPLGVLAAMSAMAGAFVATYREQNVLALALITFAVTAGFVASWSASTLRTTIGPLRHR